MSMLALVCIYRVKSSRSYSASLRRHARAASFNVCDEGKSQEAEWRAVYPGVVIRERQLNRGVCVCVFGSRFSHCLSLHWSCLYGNAI